MAYFPLFVEIEGKDCAVAGGGKVAYRKIESLLKFGGRVKVVAPAFCSEILALKDKVSLVKKEACPEDFEGCFLVIAATNAREVNRGISEYCKMRGIFVNVIDSQEECSFVFPAVVKRGDVSIGITTSGGSPALSAAIRKSVEQSVPEFYGELSEKLKRWRKDLKKRIADEKVRRAVFTKLVEAGIQKGGNLSQEDLEEIIADPGEKDSIEN